MDNMRLYDFVKQLGFTTSTFSKLGNLLQMPQEIIYRAAVAGTNSLQARNKILSALSSITKQASVNAIRSDDIDSNVKCAFYSDVWAFGEYMQRKK